MDCLMGEGLSWLAFGETGVGLEKSSDTDVSNICFPEGRIVFMIQFGFTYTLSSDGIFLGVKISQL